MCLYSFADVSSMIEELFNFDNIHSLNFVDKQVLVLVLHLAPAGTLGLGLGLGT